MEEGGQRQEEDERQWGKTPATGGRWTTREADVYHDGRRGRQTLATMDEEESREDGLRRLDFTPSAT